MLRLQSGGAGSLDYCLSPYASSWPEGKTSLCSEVDDTLEIVECAESGISLELAAWRSSTPPKATALRRAREALDWTRTFLLEAEASARQIAPRLEPGAAEHIKMRRLELEDLNRAIGQVLEPSRPGETGQGTGTSAFPSFSQVMRLARGYASCSAHVLGSAGKPGSVVSIPPQNCNRIKTGTTSRTIWTCLPTTVSSLG